jgi:hypothetical protein
MASPTTVTRRFLASVKVTNLKSLIEDFQTILKSLEREGRLSDFFIKSVKENLHEAERSGVEIPGHLDLDGYQSVFKAMISFRSQLKSAMHVGAKMRLYHGTTEKFTELNAGEDLTDEEKVAESYAKERARERGKSTIYIYEFHVEAGSDVGDKRYNSDQGHDQWQSKRKPKPVHVRTEYL